MKESVYSDQELWQRTRSGNKAAFDEIYERHWSTLMITAYNVLGEKEVCRDIIHDVFTDLWIRKETLSISSLQSYLKVAVRNLVFKHLRRGYVRKKHLKSMENILFVNKTEQMVNFNQAKELYEESVAKLPERCREVFLLSRVENLSGKEIAARLDISPKTVENHITKALKHLRDHMGELISLLVIFIV